MKYLDHRLSVHKPVKACGRSGTMDGTDRPTHCHLVFSQNQTYQDVFKVSLLLSTQERTDSKDKSALNLLLHTGHRKQANNKQIIQLLHTSTQNSAHELHFFTDTHTLRRERHKKPKQRLPTFNVQGLNDIMIYQFEVLMTNPVLHISFPARKEVVHNCNLMAIHHQFVSKMRTHKPCSSSYLRQDSWYKFLFLFTETLDKVYKHEDRTVGFRSLLTPGETTPFPCIFFSQDLQLLKF